RDHAVAGRKADAPDAGRSTPLEHPYVGHREADALAVGGGEDDVVILGAGLDADDRLAVGELHRDLAVGADVDEIGKLVAPDRAAGGGEHDVEAVPAVFVLGQRHD